MRAVLTVNTEAWVGGCAARELVVFWQGAQRDSLVLTVNTAVLRINLCLLHLVTFKYGQFLKTL